ILLNWGVIIKVALWPSTALLEHIKNFVTLTTGPNSLECAYIGFSLEVPVQKGVDKKVASMFIILVLLAIIVIYSTIEINATLEKGAFSDVLRKLHQQMLKLLLLQTTCPLLLLHGPCFVACTFLFLGLTSTTILSCIISTLFALFPALSPVIIIVFLKDYREYTLSILRIKKQTMEPTFKIVSIMRSGAHGTQQEGTN
ncbi:hypothetical protein TELCIR_17085, partial [Teladorsagia circumcincta]